MVSPLIWTRMGSWRQDKRDGGGSRRAAWPPSSGRRNHSRSCPGPPARRRGHRRRGHDRRPGGGDRAVPHGQRPGRHLRRARNSTPGTGVAAAGPPVRDVAMGAAGRGADHGTAGVPADVPDHRVLRDPGRHHRHQREYPHCDHVRVRDLRRVLRGHLQPVPPAGLARRAGRGDRRDGGLPGHLAPGAGALWRAAGAAADGGRRQCDTYVAPPGRRVRRAPAPGAAGARGRDPPRRPGGAGPHRQRDARRGDAQRERHGGAGRRGPAGAGQLARRRPRGAAGRRGQRAHRHDRAPAPAGAAGAVRGSRAWPRRDGRPGRDVRGSGPGRRGRRRPDPAARRGPDPGPAGPRLRDRDAGRTDRRRPGRDPARPCRLASTSRPTASSRRP